MLNPLYIFVQENPYSDETKQQIFQTEYIFFLLFIMAVLGYVFFVLD